MIICLLSRLPVAPAPATSMIVTTYHDFGLLWWVICPVCPTQSRDITSLGWARTGGGDRWGGFGGGWSGFVPAPGPGPAHSTSPGLHRSCKLEPAALQESATGCTPRKREVGHDVRGYGHAAPARQARRWLGGAHPRRHRDPGGAGCVLEVPQPVDQYQPRYRRRSGQTAAPVQPQGAEPPGIRLRQHRRADPETAALLARRPRRRRRRLRDADDRAPLPRPPRGHRGEHPAGHHGPHLLLRVRTWPDRAAGPAGRAGADRRHPVLRRPRLPVEDGRAADPHPDRPLH